MGFVDIVGGVISETNEMKAITVIRCSEFGNKFICGLFTENIISQTDKIQP